MTDSLGSGSKRKSGRLEKQAPAMSPVKRKSTQSPLRRSERGKKDVSSTSSESRNLASASNSFEANRKKTQQEKTLNVGSATLGISSKNDKEASGIKRKLMDARSYRAIFRTQRIKETAADDLQRMDAPSDTDCAVRELSSSEMIKPREEEGNNCVRELANDAEEECLQKFEDCTGRLVSSSPSSGTANISRDVGEVDSLDSIFRGSVTEESNAEVSPELEMVDCDSLGASAGFDALRKSNQSINSRILDPSCDVVGVSPSLTEHALLSTAEKYHCFVGTCRKCSKVPRLKHDSPEQELCYCNGAKDPEAKAMLRSAEKSESCDKLVGAPGDPHMGCHDQVCYVCCKDGNLLFCHGMGCGNCYHIDCLDPPLGDVLSMVWHCIWCVQKKIGSGVHSVSKGVEEIWDSRDVMISDTEGKHLQKQYLVKYQGLAHVHNHWVLQYEVSHLVDRFIQNQQQGLRWNSEWTVPHRLLKKRSLKFPEQQKSSGSCSDSITFCCQYEWLVKWCKLGYEHATWELDNTNFLQSSLGDNLVREYELRMEKVKRGVDKSREWSCVEMTKLPLGGSIITDCSILNNVNKLREFWYKDQNAVVFDDKDRVVSSIFFILSMIDNGDSFLVIANADATSHWETEFRRVAPSVDFVVYAGNEESRRNIRALEFYEEGGRVIPQVLLASSEAALQDVHLLKDRRWGAILVDQLDARLSTHLEQMRTLTTNTRVILFASQLKDRAVEYLDVLSLLDCHDSSKGGGVKCENNINKLKEQLASYIAYGCMVEPAKFVEYWVPAQLSNLQLEQYCATLLSNSVYLCSCSKNDQVGVLREILLTIRKCCDHPYLVDPTLQGSIIKGLPLSEILDAGIKASGKLQLLDMILSEIKARQSRVLILFQPIVGSAMSIGDILDDFVRQRFGQNSYERVDTHVSKKQASLNRFNQKESQQFVFLLEKGACVPSIKLASVDTVVIFDSDWNPGNDFRALQKISIDSQFSQIKVFRLYSACTIEEKALILAKQDIYLGNNLQNISRGNTDTLLSWGVSNLFNRLEEFHSRKSRTMVADIPSEDLHANDVLREFQVILMAESELEELKNSIIPKVKQLKGVYCTNFPLPGEINIQSALGGQPHIFWKNLLEGRNPSWRYPCSMTRSRKRGQYLDGSSKKQEMENDDVGKKRRKVVANGMNTSPAEELAADHGVRHANQSLPLPATGGGASSPSPSSSLNSHDNVSLPERDQDRCVEKLISNEQKSIHIYLTAEMEKLCEILALKEDMKQVLHAFLGYVVENHRVSEENVAIFQALQISLCWIAASMLKRKIDRSYSLMLAKKKLSFLCSYEEADYVYKKLRMLKKRFLQQPDILKELQALINPTLTEEHVLKDILDAETLEPVHTSSDVQETAHGENLTDLEHGQDDQGCNHESEIMFMSMLREKQKEEIDEFRKAWEEKRLLLEKKNSVEAAVIRQIHSQNIVVRMEKLKVLDTDFSQKLEEHMKLMEAGLKDLEVKHLAALIEEREKSAQCPAKYCGIENITSNEVPISSFPATGLAIFNRAQGTASLSSLHIEEHTYNDMENRLLTNNVSPHAGSVGCTLTLHSCNKVVNDLQSPYAAVSNSTVVAVGCNTPIDSDTRDELVTDVQTSNGSQSCSSVCAVVDAVAIDLPCETTHTLYETVNNLQTNDDAVLDVCVDAANEAEGCAVRMEIGSAPGYPTSERIELTVPERTSVLTDEEDNEKASPVKHPKSDRETHDKVPSVSNVVNQHYVCKGINSATTVTNSKSHDEPFPGEANESIPAHMPEDAHEELTNIGDPDTNATAIQSNGEDDGENRVVGCETPDLLGNQRDGANGIVPFSEKASLLAHPDEETDRVDYTISAPRQGTTEELPQCSMSTEVRGEDLPNHGFLSKFAESIESENMAQLVTTHDLTGEVGGSSSGAANNGLTAVTLGPESCGSLQATETTHPVEEPPNHSYQPPPQVLENLGPSSASDIENRNIGNHMHTLPLVSTGEPTSGFCASLLGIGQPPMVEEGAAQRINRAVLQTANQLGLSNSHPSVQADPLQIELEKLRKELDQATKGHENLKSQLRSNCEKEMAEVVAEIHKKYEAKLHDAEALFKLKKKTLDTNVNKVFLNKILADAVSTKCIDVRPSGVWRQQGFMQQLQHISLQPTQGPASVGLSSAGGTTAAPLNTSLTLPAEPRSVGVSSCRPPTISSISCPQTNARVGADIRAVAPHLQSVRADVRAAAPHLLPVGVDNRAAAPHLQPFGIENRAVPPHLQPFRPPVSITAPIHSLSHSVTTQQLPVNQPSLTLPSQVLPVQPRVQPSEPSPRITHTTPTEFQRVEKASYHSTHPSALELLRDIDRRFKVVTPNPSVSTVVPDSNAGPVSESVLRGVQCDLTSSVVYLSDDE